MTSEPMDSELARARTDVIGRLQARGVSASVRDSSEDLVRLLDAVEEFERTVQRRGGDLMVDEPVSSGRQVPEQPDDRAFVLPTRREHETVPAFIERIDKARKRAADV